MHKLKDPTLEQLTEKAISGDIGARARLTEHPAMWLLLDEVSAWAARTYKLERDEIRENVLVAIFNRLETLTRPSDLEGWCYGVAKNYCLNQLRHLRIEKRYQELELANQQSRRGRRHGVPVEPSYLVPSPEEELLAKEQRRLLREALQRAIQSLPDSPDSLVKAWMEGKTAKQISEETGLPLSTVYRRVTKMQKAFLKELLSEIEAVRGQTQSLQTTIENEKLIARYMLEELRAK
jgi:RNA polymerase sigma factor (sigma-70 family)